jgi:dTDP-4-amino-4,6-dideoxygalactose transaminase
MVDDILNRFAQVKRHVYHVPWAVPSWGWAELFASLTQVVRGRTVRGAYPQELSSAIAGHLGKEYGLSFNRGRTAIQVALAAMGLGRGDEVVIPSYVCATAIDGIMAAGCTPVFCDVGEDMHVTVESVLEAVTPATRCVIVPHLFGNAAPVDAIERALQPLGIPVIDDAAQSFGAWAESGPVGGSGRCGIVAMGPGKALAGAAGGVLVTADPGLYERAHSISLPAERGSLVRKRAIAMWIWRRFRRLTLPFHMVRSRFLPPREETHSAGLLANLDAALGMCQLSALARNADRRRHNARVMADLLPENFGRLISELDPGSMVLKLVIVLPAGDGVTREVIDALGEAGVECQAGYTPQHLSKPEFDARPMNLPATEALWKRVLCVPVDTLIRGEVRRDQVRRALESVVATRVAWRSADIGGSEVS